jgi:hypothetical protein
VEPLFKILLENISLTEKQEEDARKKYNGVCEALHNHYYPNTTYGGSTKFLYGSYGKNTNIRPPRDVDVLFKMPGDEFARIDSLAGNKQSQLLQEIRLVLKDAYTTTEKISALGMVVVVEFAEGTHKVDLLPAWEVEGGKFRMPNTENGGSWQIIDPASQIKHIQDSNRKTGKTLSLIRIGKRWVQYCNVPLKSFVVELLVVQYLDSLNEESLGQGFKTLVPGLLAHMIAQADRTIFSGSGEMIPLGDEWKSRAESAYQRAQKALEFEEVAKMEEASLEWKKLFGDEFPRSETTTASDSLDDKIAGLAKQYPSSKEEFLNRPPYNIPFQIDPAYAVEIDARVDQAGFQPGPLSRFLQKRFYLKKKKKLMFEITHINVPGPYSVYWKVRNFGEEAKNAEGLRGEITLGVGRKEESTLYYGTHYVECYIVKNGICVAVGRIYVPIGTEYEN